MPLILDNKYTLGRLLGEGGFCKVYEAKDENGYPFAVKTWKQAKKKMFEDEIKAIDLEPHPHLVKYFASSPSGTITNPNSGKSVNVSYILMEFVGGGEFLQTLIDFSGFNDAICRYFFH